MRKIFSLIAAVLFAGGMMATEVTVSKTVPELVTAYSWANGTVVTPFALDEVITVSTDATDPNTGKYYSGGQQVRLYQTGAAKLIISAAEGYSISSITLTYVSYNTGILLEAESGVAVDFENVQSATFTVGNSGTATNGQARITAFSVTYNGEGGSTPTVATPVIAGEETFEESVEVSITCATEGAAIYYTLDGVDPSENSLEYTAPFTITATTTVKAIAYVAADDVYSAIASKTFTKVEPVVIPQYEVATAIAAGLTDGTEIQVRGIVTKMELKGTNFKKYGSVNIYVADATGAAGEFEFYNCYSMNADTFKVTVPASAAESTTFVEVTEVSDANGYAIHVGDTVVAQGKYKLYNSTHELNTGCYIVYAKAPGAEFPTNIENAATEQKAIKFFENGQLFINKNGVIYNAQGAVVR